MFALAATVAVLLLIPPQAAKAGALRVLIAGAACVLGGVVAIGVIGLRWHYFTDTVACAALGIGTVCGLHSFWTCLSSGGGLRGLATRSQRLRNAGATWRRPAPHRPELSARVEQTSGRGAS